MSDVAALLATGDWTLTATRRAVTETRRLEVEVREVMLTYRAHRVRPISGGSAEPEIASRE